MEEEGQWISECCWFRGGGVLDPIFIVTLYVNSHWLFNLFFCQKLKISNEIISIDTIYENIASINLNAQIKTYILIRTKMNMFKEILQDSHISLLDIGVELSSLQLDPADSHILSPSAICITE